MGQPDSNASAGRLAGAANARGRRQRRHDMGRSAVIMYRDTRRAQGRRGNL